MNKLTCGKKGSLVQKTARNEEAWNKSVKFQEAVAWDEAGAFVHHRNQEDSEGYVQSGRGGVIPSRSK